MNNFSLEVGAAIRLGGRSFVVESCAPRSLGLKDARTHEAVTHSRADLTRAFHAGELQFEDLFDAAGKDGDCSSEPIPKGLSEYPERVRTEALLRRGLLLSLCPRGPLQIRRAELPQAIHEAWNKLPGSANKPAPSVSTFYSWRKRWWASEKRDDVLVSQYTQRGRRPAPLPPGLAPLIEQAVDRFYVSDTRRTITETHKHAIDLVFCQNRMRSPADQLPRPTRRQIERQIAKVDRFLLIERRRGRKAAIAQTAVYGSGPGAERLLERVEIDHTPMDILCIAEDSRTVLGRPWLTSIIDVASRMVLAVWISFRAPSANTILRTLKQAILPKDEILRRYELKGEWPARGVPIGMVSDNGPELHSNALDSAAQDLGISLTYCPKNEPRFKGVIERFMKTVNYSFVHTLPGTTFEGPDERGEYASEAKAVLTVEGLRALVYKWVVEVYSLEYHRGIQTCPLQKWKELERLNPPVLPRRPEVLDVMLRPVVERRLSSKGVELNSLFYTGAVLADLRHHRGNVTLSVRPNPDNLGSIEVLHPDTGTYFKATCTRPDYAEGLTLEQHCWLRQVARRDYKALPIQAGIVAAKREMTDKVDALIAQRTQGRREASQEKAPSVKEAKTKASRSSRRCSEEMAERAAMQHEQPMQAATPQALADVIAFDAIEAFPSGQVDLFPAEKSWT